MIWRSLFSCQSHLCSIYSYLIGNLCGKLFGNSGKWLCPAHRTWGDECVCKGVYKMSCPHKKKKKKKLMLIRRRTVMTRDVREWRQWTNMPRENVQYLFHKHIPERVKVRNGPKGLWPPSSRCIWTKVFVCIGSYAHFKIHTQKNNDGMQSKPTFPKKMEDFFFHVWLRLKMFYLFPQKRENFLLKRENFPENDAFL